MIVETTGCPVCFGEGYHDHRDDDAVWSELYSDRELDRLRGRGLVHPVGVVACGECEGTGVVTVERARDLRAAAVSFVDQVIATARERGIL